MSVKCFTNQNAKLFFSILSPFGFYQNNFNSWKNKWEHWEDRKKKKKEEEIVVTWVSATEPWSVKLGNKLKPIYQASGWIIIVYLLFIFSCMDTQ